MSDKSWRPLCLGDRHEERRECAECPIAEFCTLTTKLRKRGEATSDQLNAWIVCHRVEFAHAFREREP